MFRSTQLISILSLLLVRSVCLGADDASILKLSVLEGEGALNNIKLGVANNLSVSVMDEQGRPVPDAQVTFTAPYGGPGVVFPNGERTVTVTTDERGIAEVKGLKPNKEEGRFNIKAAAVQGSRQGSMVIAQANTLAGGVAADTVKHSSKKTWILLGVLGGVGAGLGVALGGGGGKSTPAAPAPTLTTLSVGTVSVGGPR